jgi:hypothetical protein
MPDQRIDFDTSFDIDRLEKSGQTSWTPVSNTLARKPAAKGYDLVFHANIKVTPVLDGAPAFNQFRMLRIQRIWSAKLSGPLPAVSAPKLVPQGPDALLPPGFYSDSNLDYFGDPLGHWIDAPLQTYDGGKNVNERLLREFVVGVGDPNKARTPVPGFGGLYFIVALDVMPDRYRIIVTTEKRLTGDEIQGVFHILGKSSPPWLGMSTAPELSAFQLNAQDWQSYKEFLK